MAGRRRDNFCGSPDHAVDRRRFLGTMAAGAAAFAADMSGLDVLKHAALAGELKKQQKRVILLWLAGGVEPARDLGPQAGRVDRRAVPGDPDQRPGRRDLRADAEDGPADGARTCIIRSLNTKNGDHGGGAKLMMQGPDATTRASATPTWAP